MSDIEQVVTYFKDILLDQPDDRKTLYPVFELIGKKRKTYEHEFLIKIEEVKYFNWECKPFGYFDSIAKGKLTMDGELIDIEMNKEHPLFNLTNTDSPHLACDHLKEQLVDYLKDIIQHIKNKEIEETRILRECNITI